jgi:RNA polymerase sigma-70 factor (ECF subfamily)
MDELAFESFYKKTARPLWSYIYRISGDAVLADDVLQESFCRFLQRSLPEMTESDMNAYLYKIATNLVKDYWRKSGREKIRFVSDQFAKDVAGEAREASVTGDEMNGAFGELKPQEQTLLWLAYVEGFKHQEIARALNLKEKSVRVLLFRARKRLADVLKLRGLGEEGQI